MNNDLVAGIILSKEMCYKLAQAIKDSIDKVNKGEEDGIHRNNESRAKS